jgi:hypothetical protein
MFSVDMVLIGASSSQKVKASDFLQFAQTRARIGVAATPAPVRHLALALD